MGVMVDGSVHLPLLQEGTPPRSLRRPPHYVLPDHGLESGDQLGFM